MKFGLELQSSDDLEESLGWSIVSMLSYRCHLWHHSKVSTGHVLDSAWTKAIRKGLRMKTQNSVTDGFKRGAKRVMRSGSLSSSGARQ